MVLWAHYTETKATYTLKRYTVTFDTNGGTFADGEDTKTETVESAQPATKPTDPTKANRFFAGWYTLKDGGKTLTDTAYDFDTPVEGDIILYAAWNGVGDDGSIVLRNKVIPKTSEVQVLSTKVTFASLYKVGVDSKVFISGRGGEIQPFVMGQYEVTQQLYFAVMGKNPSNFKTGTENEEPKEGERELPVEQVSWYDAVVFCNELTKKVLGEGACVYYSDAEFTAVYTTGDVTDGKTPYMDISKSGYRLPTEAEWELAARGGKPEEVAWQNTYAGSSTIGDVAWHYDNSEYKTHEVGTKAPNSNSLGLYDMSGNVQEWCWDWWSGSIDTDTPFDGAASGKYDRVNRGGSWSNNAGDCTVSNRNKGGYLVLDDSLGFRLVCSAN